jgi:hypothetical protein
MPEVVSVEEFKNEGFAIVEDTAGKFVISKHSPDMVPIEREDKKNKMVVPPVSSHKLCALVQSRDRMLT